MVPGNRPNAAEAADQRVDRARVRRGSRRLATAVQDFLLDPAERLTEQELALMNAMLHGLVERLADEIRTRLPDELAAGSECHVADLVLDLSRSGLLDRPELIELLLRRADVLRLSQAIVAEPRSAHDSLLQRWVSDEVDEVASAAMAVVLARASAKDRFGRPGLELVDCPAEVAVELSYAVAAAISRRLENADEELVAAAVDVLAGHDEGQRLDALEARLIRELQQAGRLDSATLVALAGAGEVSLLCEALCRLAGIPGETGWSLFVDAEDGRLALLLRMAEQPRTLAATLFARLADPLGIADPVRELDWFDRISEGEAASARTRLRLPPAYQQAVTALEGHGKRLA
jgi:hypothetical protein